MSEIRLLDSSVINLIAAGEVVDRPASAVKEMVENAIDAGAKHISVEIRKGGLGMIRISDDGCGMTAENARKAFLKHATSKIRTEEDLNSIGTLGFRGEALAAISAVSKVVLTTKVPGETGGVRFTVSEGKILSEEECGCPDGSCFTVEDLFFNTPARLKFMKSEPAEAGAVQSVMERLALSHPQISFRFNSNGTERLHTPGNGNLLQTVFSVFGKEFAEMSLPTDLTTGDVRVRGLIGKPVYSKANRGRQIFFLNGRYVRSPILTAGLENSYHNKMLIGRVPVCVLFVDLPASQVDVNVHPSKLEVKFADENGVSYAVRKATEAALAADSGIVEMRVAPPVTEPKRQEIPPLKNITAKVFVPEKKESVSVPAEKPVPSVKPPVEKKNSIPRKTEAPAVKAAPPVSESIPIETSKSVSGWQITPPPAPPRQVLVRDVIQPAVPSRPAPAPNVVFPVIPKEEKASVKKEPPVPAATAQSPAEEPVLFRTEAAFRMIGEAFGCYILVEKEEDLLFIDKHALHERMNFERLKKSDVPSQSLLQPIVLHIGIDENRILAENADFPSLLKRVMR